MIYWPFFAFTNKVYISITNPENSSKGQYLLCCSTAPRSHYVENWKQWQNLSEKKYICTVLRGSCHFARGKSVLFKHFNCYWFWKMTLLTLLSYNMHCPNLRELVLFHPYFVNKCSFREISNIIFLFRIKISQFG